jgi:hypothetical protein
MRGPAIGHPVPTGSLFAPPTTMATSWAAGFSASEVNPSFGTMGKCQSVMIIGILRTWAKVSDSRRDRMRRAKP